MLLYWIMHHYSHSFQIAAAVLSVHFPIRFSASLHRTVYRNHAVADVLEFHYFQFRAKWLWPQCNHWLSDYTRRCRLALWERSARRLLCLTHLPQSWNTTFGKSCKRHGWNKQVMEFKVRTSKLLVRALLWAFIHGHGRCSTRAMHLVSQDLEDGRIHIDPRADTDSTL